MIADMVGVEWLGCQFRLYMGGWGVVCTVYIIVLGVLEYDRVTDF